MANTYRYNPSLPAGFVEEEGTGRIVQGDVAAPTPTPPVAPAPTQGRAYTTDPTTGAVTYLKTDEELAAEANTPTTASTFKKLGRAISATQIIRET